MDLDAAQEQEILRRFRELSSYKKEAVLTSERSFEQWLKTSLRWLWDQLSRALIRSIFSELIGDFGGDIIDFFDF